MREQCHKAAKFNVDEVVYSLPNARKVLSNFLTRRLLGSLSSTTVLSLTIKGKTASLQEYFLADNTFFYCI